MSECTVHLVSVDDAEHFKQVLVSHSLRHI